MRSIDKVKKNRVDREGRKQGYWEFYYPGGNLASKGLYLDDKIDGIWEFYYVNGVMHTKGSYKDGLQEGMWEYYQNGVLREKELWNNDVLIKVL